MRFRYSFLAAALAASLGAQSPLTTTFASNNGGATGGQVFFDLTVNSPVTIQGLDVNLGQVVGIVGTIELYRLNAAISPATYLGNEVTAANWTLASSGPVVSRGGNIASPVCLGTPLQLTPGNYSFAVRYIGVSALYTNGTGSTLPGGGAGSNQTYNTAELQLRAGLAQNTPFVGGFAPRVWNGSIHYLLGAQPTACSSSVSTGTGCYQAQGSFYELYTSPATAQATLQGHSITFLYAPSGYTVFWDLLPAGTAYVPPTPSATNPVAAGDATSATVPLSSPLLIPDAVPSSAVNQLWIHTNGFVGAADVLPTFRINANFPVIQPPVSAVDALLNASATCWYVWHDIITSDTVGSGQIRFEEVGGVAYVTFEAVELAPSGVANPATFQFQFDLNSNNVTVVFETIPTIGGATTSDNWLVGYSGGGPSFDPGQASLPAITGTLLDPIENALTLSLSGLPRTGTTVNLTTSELPAGAFLGINFLGLVPVPIPGGLDLGIIGAPGCPVFLDPSAAVGNALIAPSLTVAFPIPNSSSFYGTVVYSQSVVLSPLSNPGGLVTSNSIAMTIGSF